MAAMRSVCAFTLFLLQSACAKPAEGDGCAGYAACMSAGYGCDSDTGGGYRMDALRENELRRAIDRCSIDNGCGVVGGSELVDIGADKRRPMQLGAIDTLYVEAGKENNGESERLRLSPKQWLAVRDCGQRIAAEQFQPAIERCMREDKGHSGFALPSMDDIGIVSERPELLYRPLDSVYANFTSILKEASTRLLYTPCLPEAGDGAKTATRRCIIDRMREYEQRFVERSGMSSMVARHERFCDVRRNCSRVLSDGCRARRERQMADYCDCAANAAGEHSEWTEPYFQCLNDNGVAVKHDDQWHQWGSTAYEPVGEAVRRHFARMVRRCGEAARKRQERAEPCGGDLWGLKPRPRPNAALPAEREWRAFKFSLGSDRPAAGLPGPNGLAPPPRSRPTFDSIYITVPRHLQRGGLPGPRRRGPASPMRLRRDVPAPLSDEQCSLLLPTLGAMVHKTQAQCALPGQAACDCAGGDLDIESSSSVTINQLFRAATGEYLDRGAPGPNDTPGGPPRAVDADRGSEGIQALAHAVHRPLLMAALRTPACDTITVWGLGGGWY